MSKEYLEALEVICGELVETDLLFIDRNGENQEKWRKSEAFAKLKEFDKKYGSPVTVLQNALQRLESIDNSNPSEALLCLEKIIDNLDDYADFEIKQEANEYIDTIKQALLKAQEPKHYLKWEDLEFKEENQRIKVKLGNNIYTLDFYVGQFGKSFAIANQYYCEANDNIQFFNDLHLERVEE